MQINENNLLIQLQTTPVTDDRLLPSGCQQKKKSTALPNYKLNLAELPKYKHSLYQHPSNFLLRSNTQRKS